MKVLLICMLTLIFTNGAQANSYEDAFNRAMNFRSSCANYIRAKGAEQIAAAAGQGELEANVVLDIYFKTCDFNRSMDIAKLVKAGKSSKAAFDKAMNFRSSCANYIRAKGAEQIAAAVSQGELETNAVLDIYFKTCDFNRSMDIAKMVKAGKSSKAAFDMAMNFRSSCANYISTKGAEQIAMAVGQGELEARVVLDTYFKTCDFKRSMDIAKMVKAGKSSKAAFDKAMNFRSSCANYIRAKGAEQIAAAVSQGELDTDTFLSFYFKSCDFQRAMRMAKAAKNSGGPSGDENESGATSSAQ